MTALSEEVTIPARLDAVWSLLSDPALVASCIPGATLAESDVAEPGRYTGTIRVKFGPTVAQFRGEVTLAYDDAARRCTIAGRGIDARGQSRARAEGVVAASAAAGAAPGAATGAVATLLSVAGDFTVTGPLESFASAGGVHVARALLAEFAANIARLAPTPPPASDAPAGSMTIPPPPAAELAGGRLLWRAFCGWLRHIFARSR